MRTEIILVRARRSTGELCVPLAAFREMDYGQVCARLGLRPSKPNAPAARVSR